MSMKILYVNLSRRVIWGMCLGLLMALPLSVAHAQEYNGPQGYNGPTITFEQVFADPANQDLNLNYARQQAAAGDYLSAASTLERLLYTQPNWDSARLFYALVLYRLDDPQAAIRELNILETRPLSHEQQQLFSTYKKLLNVDGVAQ